MSQNITIGQITEIPPGDSNNPVWINEDFEAIVTNVKESKTKTGKVYATATLQDPHSTNIAIDATFWVSGMVAKQGKVCHFSGQGMKLEEYKGNLKLTIGDKAKINVVGGAPARAAASAPQSRAPSATPTGKKPIHGATVGMAINQAIAIIKDTIPEVGLSDYYLTPAFGADLHTLASDIIRVSTYLEAGNLAAPSSKRTPQPAPAPEPEPEPEPEPTPPPAAQQQQGDDGEDVPFNGAPN